VRPPGLSGRQWTKLRKKQRRCKHLRQVTPEGQYTTFKCLDCGFVGDVPKKETKNEGLVNAWTR
jgi:hypothetical protein